MYSTCAGRNSQTCRRLHRSTETCRCKKTISRSACHSPRKYRKPNHRTSASHPPSRSCTKPCRNRYFAERNQLRVYQRDESPTYESVLFDVLSLSDKEDGNVKNVQTKGYVKSPVFYRLFYVKFQKFHSFLDITAVKYCVTLRYNLHLLK